MSLSALMSSYSSVPSEEDELSKAEVGCKKRACPDSKDRETSKATDENVFARAKRIRTFEHEVGNWASYFYVPFPNARDIFNLLESHLHEFESEGFYLCKDFHISLSRTLVLKHFMINAVFLSMKPLVFQLKSSQCLLAGVKPFQNEEKTTSFLSLSVVTGVNLLNSMIELIDKYVCRLYNLPTFYEDRDLHMSLFWKNGPIEKTHFLMAKKLDQVLDQHTAEQGNMFFSAIYDDILNFEIEEIVFKSGCKPMILPLCIE